MKKILFLLLSCSIVCQGQKDSSRFTHSFGLNSSLDYTSQILVPERGQNSISVQSRIDNFNEDYRGIVGGTAGINYKLGIMRRWRLEIGVMYSYSGNKTKKYDLIWTQPDPEKRTHMSFVNTYEYISSPTKVHFLVNKTTATNKFYAILGFQQNYLFDYQISTKYYYADRESSSSDWYYPEDFRLKKTVSNSTIIGVGINRKIHNKLSLDAEILYRQAVTEPEDDFFIFEFYGIDVLPYSIAANFSLNYIFQ